MPKDSDRRHRPGGWQFYFAKVFLCLAAVAFGLAALGIEDEPPAWYGVGAILILVDVVRECARKARWKLVVAGVLVVASIVSVGVVWMWGEPDTQRLSIDYGTEELERNDG